MLQTWVQQQGGNTSANELQRALSAIGRDDVIEACMVSRVEEVTDVTEKQQAMAFFEGGICYLLINTFKSLCNIIN